MRRRFREGDGATSHATRRQRDNATPFVASRDSQAFASSGPLARLPWACVGETVVSFLATPSHLAVRQPCGLDVRGFRMQLAPLLLVCGHWKRLVLSLVEAYAKQVRRVEFTNSERQARQTQGTTREQGEHVLQLQCLAQYPTKMPSAMLMVPRSSRPVECLGRIDWSLLLTAFPLLVRLDLFDVCLSLVDKLLPVASTVCPNVQVLVLPHKRTSTFGDFQSFEKITSHLVAALRAWYSSNGGLVDLCIPEWPSEPNGQYNKLLSTVATYCPRLEHLRGWDKRNPMGPLITRCVGNVEPRVWKAFCESCTQLREFTWRLAPLSPTFVDHFRSTQKPMLADLRVEDSCPTSNPADISSLESMFAALPRLALLSLWMPNYCTVAAQQGRARSSSLDTLVASVLYNCGQLESFRCFFPRSLEPAKFVSADTLVRLVDHVSVREVVISPISLPCNSLRQMLEAIVASNKRCYCAVELMAVGSVHEAIVELLRFLENDGTILISHLRFQLTVTTPDGYVVDEGTEAVPLFTKEDVTKRVAKIRARYADTISQLEVATELVDGQPGRVFTGVKLRINVPQLA